MAERLVIVKNLIKYYPVKAGILQRTVNWVRAVDDISFDIRRGETLGLVGESGCGKTTAGKAMINLIRPTAGEVLFNISDNSDHAEYINIAGLSKRERRRARKMVQIIFQNPYSSLNPRMTVFRMMKEVIAYHKLVPAGRTAADLIREVVNTVGLQPTDIYKYPHEFSGGQRQRIGIARALLISPKLIVCDEPVSALDVSIQAQIINLLAGLKHDLGLTYLFIAHDLAVVKHISDRIAIMYLGKIMEVAPRQEFFTNPLHPYTETLLSAIPIPNPDRKKERILLTGEVPSPMRIPAGCRFHTRCPLAEAVCRQTEPELTTRSGEHKVACHFR